MRFGGEIFNKFTAINIFWGLFKDVEKTFPVPAGDEYGLEVKVKWVVAL